MSHRIRKVAVLGAGTMGAAIAAHCANAGLEVDLLDIAPDDDDDKNAVVEAGFDRMQSARPAALMGESVADRIRIGNFEEHFERGLEGIPVDPDVREWFRRMIVEELPETLTDEQLAAWVELSELAADDGFIRTLREQTGPFWKQAEGSFDPVDWHETIGGAFREAGEAVREGRPPTGEREQRVVEALVGAHARAMNRTEDPGFEAWLLRHYDETADPRMERYWRLVSVLKEIDYDPTAAEAQRWLIEGLRRRVAQRPGSGHAPKD